MKITKFLSSSALVGATFACAVPAWAQVAGPPQGVVPAQEEEAVKDGTIKKETPAKNADGSDSNGQTITVTGSRIKLPNLQSLEPITTLDRRQLEERNFTNIADALNELPGVRGSVTPAGGQGFGQGTNFLNNLGLGSNRTLTLVNGRRFVSSNVASLFTNGAPGTQVDLNVIPSILVNRIDNLSVGGAPVYGSDAIAGTLNILLRSKYEGIEVEGLTGITEEGDNFRYNVSGLFGGNLFNDRLNLTFAVSHDDVKGLVANDRDFLRLGLGGATNPSAAQALALRGALSNPGNDGRLNSNIGFNNSTTDLNPGTVIVRGVNIPFLTRGGLISRTNLTPTGTQAFNPNDPASVFGGFPTNNALQFDTNGNLVPFNQGVVFPGTSGSGGQGFSFQDFTQITSDLRRTILDGFITFKLTDNVELFGEGTYYRARADELVQQPTFNSSLFGGASGALNFNVDNPFLTPQARAALVARGVTTFSVSRASADLADLTGFNKTEIYRGVAGIRGDFAVFGRSFNFEAYVNGGKTKVLDAGQDIDRQRFVNAVNVTRNAAGQVVCTTTPAVNATPGFTPMADPNCVPLNLLGEGRASQAARDYVIANFTTRAEQEQRVYNANVGGTLFDIAGGAVGINVGYEHRDEKAAFTPSQFQQLGSGRSVAITPLTGKYNLDEAFGEVVIPLVSPEMGLSFLHSAEFFGRGRYVDSTVNGGFFSYTAGGTISPVQDVQFRGNYTKSFRSPAVTELFLPIVNAFNTVPDLCQPASRNAGPAPLIRARNCAAFNARFPTTADIPDPASTATVPVQSGGNPNLQNERANSYTFGVIVQPRFLPRFAATVDYISITLKQPIANLGVAAIVSGCFDNPDFNTADPLNGNSFCSQINRNPTTGRVVNDPATPAVRGGFVNGQEIQFRGIQSTMGYSIPLDAIGVGGTLSFGGDLLYVRKRLVDITGVAPTRSDGVLGDPEFSGQLRVRYNRKNFGINTTINYVGEQLFSRLNRDVGVAGSGPDAREIDKLNDYVVVSGGMFFDATEAFRLTLSVNNVFNRRFQKYFDAFIPASVNDQIGRSFAASARVRF